jgi:lipopolysaccharide biosynthesis glycosyltransferase
MKKVLVVISDENYLDHAGSLFVNAINEGKWDGDLCLIANNIDDLNRLIKFKEMGVEVLHKKCDNPYIINLHVFDTYFKKWDYVVYMDCDFIIFKPLNDYLNFHDLNYGGIIADKEPFKINEYLCQGWEPENKKNALHDLNLKYDLNKFGFNAGFFSFNTKVIKNETIKDLFKISEEIKNVNNHTHPTGSDQPIFNLYFNENILYIKNNTICFWNLINNDTVAAHFCRWEAPWNNNNYSNLLGKTYYQKYKENLDIFNASTCKL